MLAQVREVFSPLELPPPEVFRAALRPPVTAVTLVEVPSCSAYDPDRLDELMDRAALLSAPREAFPAATAALAGFVKRLLCWWEEWPADDVWSEDAVGWQDASWREDVGPGPYPPLAPERAVEEARWVLAAIGKSRVRAGRKAFGTWPEEQLEAVWALRFVANDVLLFGRTAARWTAFAWSTTA
jgi:hypothetical protein